MKKLKKLLLFTVSFVLLCACSTDHETPSNASINSTNSSLEVQKLVGKKTTPAYSPNKLIIQYYPGVSNATKMTLRAIYGAIDFKSCQQCNDDTIELWTFGPGINIEPKKTAIETGSGGGVESIMDVDYEFNFALDAVYSPVVNNSANDYSPFIKQTNNGVTIAVFDTGIAPTINNNGQYAFTTPFLFNAANDGNPSTQSGWDFVNSDANCFDDDPGKHGTVVSGIIHRILNVAQPPVPHQILPIKVCDASGRASYFNLLCGVQFAVQRARILQMSLGWYDDGFGDFAETIFSNLVSLNPQVLFVTSAGNLSNNNDVLKHYPSGYPQSNIIAVAATNVSTTNIAIFSNYGLNSVDFFAKGEGIPFLGNSMDGTSFAAPMVAAVVAKKRYQNPQATTTELLNHLIQVGVICPPTFDINKKVQYGKIILP